MLPMLQLSQGNPNGYHSVPGGHWLVRKALKPGHAMRARDTGLSEIRVSLLCSRAKAVDFSNHSKAVVSYRPDTTLFKKIMGRSDTPDTQCQWGPEYLVYVHDGLHPGFATLFGGSKTQRVEYLLYNGFCGAEVVAPSFTQDSLCPVVILKSKQKAFGGSIRPPFVTYRWFAPQIVPTAFWWQSPEPLTDMMVEFMDPPATAIELASRLQEPLAKVNEALSGLLPDDKRAVVKAATGLSDLDQDE